MHEVGDTLHNGQKERAENAAFFQAMTPNASFAWGASSILE